MHPYNKIEEVALHKMGMVERGEQWMYKDKFRYLKNNVSPCKLMKLKQRKEKKISFLHFNKLSRDCM